MAWYTVHVYEGSITFCDTEEKLRILLTQRIYRFPVTVNKQPVFP
jgi:hypothetical protein